MGMLFSSWELDEKRVNRQKSTDEEENSLGVLGVLAVK
jgi:hypothetical protein